MLMLTPKIGCLGEAGIHTEWLDAFSIPKKCIWITISKNDTTGLFFFEDDRGNEILVRD